MKPEVKIWIEKAEEDRLAAEWLLQEDSPVVLPAIFHIQQSAEKFLKGYLTSRSVQFEKKHDLTYLLLVCPDQAPMEFSGFCEELSPFAVEIRYPGDYPPVSRTEGLAHLELLNQFKRLLLNLIEPIC